jgi:hypothetical protein
MRFRALFQERVFYLNFTASLSFLRVGTPSLSHPYSPADTVGAKSAIRVGYGSMNCLELLGSCLDQRGNCRARPSVRRPLF